MARLLYQVLPWFAPEGSFRHKALRLGIKFFRTLRQRGWSTTIRKVRAKLRQKMGRLWPNARRAAVFEPTSWELKEQRRRVWPTDAPRLTLLVLVDKARVLGLKDTLASLVQQTYPHWDVCLLADEEEAGTLQTLTERKLKSNPFMILPVAAGRQPGDSLAAALAAASGDFVGVIDAGDTLPPHALYRFAQRLSGADSLDVAYGDEEAVSPRTGKRHGMILKPDWSPEMLLGHNYIGRLAFIRRTLLLKAGGFDPAFGQAQEYEALLRVSEHTSRIGRVPHRLYRRRAEQAARPGLVQDPHQARLEVEAVRCHLRRRGLDARVETQPNGIHRATWPIHDPPLVSIIIPTLNNLEVLRQCLDGLLHRTSYPSREIILVDNNSTDPAVHRYYEELAQTGMVKIIPYHQKFNYSEACNVGYRHAKGSLLLFLNNDTEVINPDWLEEMVRFALLPGVGCVGTLLLYPNGVVQHAGVIVGMHLCGLIYNKVPQEHWDLFGSPLMYRDLLGIMGACQMLPRHVFEEVGGFDERYRMANSDVAICLRAWKAGYRTVYTPYAALYHHEGFTRGRSNPPEDITMTLRDLRELDFVADPYFHPDLSPDESTPVLRSVQEPQAEVESAPGVLNIFDDAAISQVAAEAGAAFSIPRQPQPEAVASEWEAVQLALALLRESPELRKRFPQALSAGVAGPFCTWLAEEITGRCGPSHASLAHLRQAFRTDPGNKVRQIYELHPELRERLPTALLPSGKHAFLAWLLEHGKADHGLRDEEIWWFLLQSAEDALRELVTTYLLSPEWQARFPEALTEAGWPAFAAWVCKRHGLESDGIPFEEFQSPLRPVEQLRWTYDSRPTLRLQFPRALSDKPGTQRLVAHVGQTFLSAVQPVISGRQECLPHGNRDRASWSQRLNRDLAENREPHLGLNIVGHFSYASGLKTSVQSVVESLRRQGVPVSCRDVPVELGAPLPDRQAFLGLETYDATLIHIQPEPFFFSAFAKAGLAPAGNRYRIGMWYWEFSQAPSEWSAHARTLQEIWAPTRFIAEGMKQLASIPVTPMLPGVNLGPVADVDRARFGIPMDRFLFLFTFDMNSIQERKNPLGLIEAYREAFRRDDRVALAIKVSRGKNNPIEMARLQAAAQSIGATVIDSTLSRAEVNGLMASCDCYVSLHRSEGLGLTMAEAMLLGKPVIATGYSANVEFMTAEDSMLVGYQLVPLKRDIYPYKKGYLWAEPSRQEAAHWMRWVYENSDDGRALGAKAQCAAAQIFSLEAAGRRLVQRLREIHHLRYGEPTLPKAA